MEKLVDDGITKSIGVSNFSLRQVDEILKVARIPPLHNQVELSPCLPQVCRAVESNTCQLLLFDNIFCWM
jgi:diketogulonate reductase-like aldo/keto reductase